MKDPIRVYVDPKLVFDVKKAHPQTKNMSVTGLVDWALRLLVASEKVDVAMINGERKNAA